MEEDVEVIFESWVLKLTGLDSRSVFRLSSQWKKRYLILIRQHESASLLYYSQKPSTLSATPRGIVVLEPYYEVEKRQNVRGQQFVVSLTTPTKRLVVALWDERLFHLLTFFLQVQVKLNEDVEDECFVVRPDNTDDQRKIGARGNMCLLHVSPCGLTVALQLSKCVIVQWPLTCIRNYESTGRGQFVLTVGKRASMGIGHYVFNTRLGQDNVMFDRLDRYVQDAACVKQNQADNVSQTSLIEQEHLHSLTYVQANPQFSNHLRKISRDIYDSLWQHLGSTRIKASSPDLVSDSPHVRQKVFRRTGSMGTLEAAGSAPTTRVTLCHSLLHKAGHPTSSTSSSLPSPDEFSSLPRNFRRTESTPSTRPSDWKPRVPINLVESTYLHPEESEEDTYENDALLYEADSPAVPAMPPPPLLRSATAFPKPLAVNRKPPLGVKGPSASSSPSLASALAQMGSRSQQKAGSPLGSPVCSQHGSTGSEPQPCAPRPRLHRMQSRSCEDLATYMLMDSTCDRNGNEYILNNGHTSGRGSGSGSGTAPQDQVYSYATQNEVEETRAAAQRLALRRASGGSQNYTPRDHQTATGFIRRPLVRQPSMKKAMSNPTLLDPHLQSHCTINANGGALRPPPGHPIYRPQLPGGYHPPPTGAGRTWGAGDSSTSISPTSPTRTSQLGSSPPPPPALTSPPPAVTSPPPALTTPPPALTTPPPAGKAVASTGGTGMSPFANRTRGIPTTSPSKVFRKPKCQAPKPGMSEARPGVSEARGREGDTSRRQESVSSGYSSTGSTTNTDLRETHC